MVLAKDSGGGEIRTHGMVSHTLALQASPFVHSGTPPYLNYSILIPLKAAILSPTGGWVENNLDNQSFLFRGFEMYK